MYVYKQGAIGEAIHAKIQSVKKSVRGRSSERVSFSDTLKEYISVNNSQKPVGTSGKANGSTIIYAMQNSNTDPSAAAVLNTLGYKQSGTVSNALRTAADELTSSAAALRTALESGTAEVKTLALSKLAEDYNSLNSRLGASGSTSGYLYRSALNGYAAGDALSGSGLAAADDGTIILTGEAPDAQKLAPFITGIAAVAGNVSAYADSIMGTGSSTNGLESYNALGSYYSTMMNLMS